MKTVAVVTMAYNERHKLEIWLKHHADQVGAKNCFIIDHGSDDGSTALLYDKSCGTYESPNFIKLPRTAYDDQVRVDAIAGLSAFLLSYYDWVVFCDSDELLLADPRKYRSLVDYFGKSDLPYVTSIGFDVVHKLGVEGALNPELPLVDQRQYL